MAEAFNVVLLKKAHEQKLDTLINGAASLKFSEFFQFALDRCIINNRVPLSKLLDLFLVAQNSKDTAGERSITKEQLIFLLN